MPGGTALTRPTFEVVGPRKRVVRPDALTPSPLPRGEGANTKNGNQTIAVLL